MSEYPNQPRSSQGGWPEQPPQYRHGQRDPRSSGYQGDSWQGDYPPGRIPRRRRRGRGWTALLVTLIVLFGAFVVIDQVARTYAQNQIASKVVSAGLPVKPSVSIKGWPFLTQVLGRDIHQVDLSAQNVREGALDISSINATALDVHISSGYHSATIDTINGNALVTFSSLIAATGASGVTLSADPSAGPHAAKISAGPLSGVASVSQSGPSSISVRAESLGGIPVSGLGQLPDYTLNVPHLPMGAAVTGVSVQSQGVSIRISARNTTLSGSSARSG
jgi:hypothetical protein